MFDEQENHSAYGKLSPLECSLANPQRLSQSHRFDSVTTPLSQMDSTKNTMKHLVLSYP